MNPIDKAALASLFCSKLDPSVSAYDRMRARLPVDGTFFDETIKGLSNLGMVEDQRLTDFGRDAIKVVLVGGVFDLIHPGHIHTLKAAKSLGDVLVVIVARTSTALKIKKDRKIYHDENLRRELVSSLNFVDLAIIGREGTLYDTVAYVRPDIIALGYDQAHTEKDVAENCKKLDLNVQVVRLSTPIPGSKSSRIKDELGENIYGI